MKSVKILKLFEFFSFSILSLSVPKFGFLDYVNVCVTQIVCNALAIRCTQYLSDGTDFPNFSDILRDDCKFQQLELELRLEKFKSLDRDCGT